MRRFLIGIAILAIFLCLGLWTYQIMDTMHTQISQTLDMAAEASLSGEQAQGVALARQAQAQWEKNWHLIALLADHAPMDEIDALFAQALYYADAGAEVDFASHCARLAKLLEAMSEAHALNWWNLL